MKIQQYKLFQFKTQFNRYGNVAHSYYQNPISYVESFLYDVYGYVYRAGGPKEFLDHFIIRENGSMIGGFNTIEFNLDTVNNIIYVGEIFDAGDLHMTDAEFNDKFGNMTSLQLCQNKIIDGAIISRNNFIKLLTTWGQLVQKKSAYILLYFDDQNWYDALPFDSKEAMENFIADHAQ